MLFYSVIVVTRDLVAGNSVYTLHDGLASFAKPSIVLLEHGRHRRDAAPAPAAPSDTPVPVPTASNASYNSDATNSTVDSNRTTNTTAREFNK